jgi:hypothetical protein
MTRRMYYDHDTGVIVVTDNARDRAKLNRRGFMALTPKRGGIDFYEFAATLLPGVYTATGFGEPGFAAKRYAWSPLDYSVKQWTGLREELQAKAWDAYWKERRALVADIAANAP